MISIRSTAYYGGATDRRPERSTFEDRRRILINNRT